MKLFTLIENKKKLEKAQIELQLIPGVPQIHFLGLPDQAIKESFLRIKSALRTSGYKFPITQQLIVNIKPNYLKKSSKGLELAVALGLLHITEQKILTDEMLQSIIYGEIDLNGDVVEPVDLVSYRLKHAEDLFFSGKNTGHFNSRFTLLNLKDEIEFNELSSKPGKLIRPLEGLELDYTEDEAELLFLMSMSGLSTLLSGAAGAGKTTLVENYKSFLIVDETKNMNWPVVLAPHSSITPAAFLGGGAQLYSGEIERAAHGVLFLDEFLEFNKDILENLRGPMTGQKLRLARSSEIREFECQFQVAATTNLCPCGKWTPEMKLRNCRYGNKKCKSTLEKLSGPVFDRFGLFYYYPEKNQRREIKGHRILERILNANLKLSKINNQLPDEVKKNNEHINNERVEKLYSGISARRRQALIKVASVIAAERESSNLDLSDLTQAEKWTYSSFMALEQGMS